VDVGGGNSAQVAYGITDSADLVFSDLTSPAAMNWGNTQIYPSNDGTKYQDRALARVEADNNVAIFDWLLANGVQFMDVVLPVPKSPPGNTHWVSASGTPRGNVPYNPVTGTSTFPSSPYSPAGNPGTGVMRPLEATARAKGVQFLLNFRMTSIIREQQYSGRVLGITAATTGGRFLPGSTTPLQSYMSQGNLALGVSTPNIRANRAVVVATGGCSSNVMRRREYDIRQTAVYSADGEPYSYQTGDGEYACRRIGASLWATGNATGEVGQEMMKPARIGNLYGCSIHWIPDSPIFPLARAGGLAVSNWSDAIEVNMAGVRFVDESTTSYTWCDAAMNINAASRAPDWAAGPIWAIFDSAAVARELAAGAVGWGLTSIDIDPLYFFQANDLPTLAQQINLNAYQTTPMDGTALQNTVNRYNSFVTAGKDSDFGKTAIKYQINTPPYYAAFASPTIHDCLTGVRINGQSQVMDLDGNIIQSLYAAGESAGGFSFHGLGKCLIFGRIAGTNAAAEIPWV